MKVNVLGTEWDVIERNDIDDPKLKECNGYCDNTIMTCVIDECKPDHPMKKSDMVKFKKKVTRHELIHAFLFESGLAENSNWAYNEEMVDWIAFQFPKLVKAFKEAECED